jgi:hypothetical protein
LIHIVDQVIKYEVYLTGLPESNKPASWSNIKELILLIRDIDPSKVDISDRKQAKEFTKAFKDLDFLISRSIKELNEISTQDTRGYY